MAAQGEQAQGGLDLEMLESMAQDEMTMQDTHYAGLLFPANKCRVRNGRSGGGRSV